MSIRRLTYVSCDGCGSNPTEPMTGGAKEARHYAQEVEGYVRRNGMDLCADCVSDAKSDKEA